MQSDILGSSYFSGYGDVLGGRKTELCCSGYGCGDAESRGFYDTSGCCDCGEVEDSGDGAGCANGYGYEDGTSEED